MPMRRPGIIVAAALSAVLLAGCGDDSDDTTQPASLDQQSSVEPSAPGAVPSVTTPQSPAATATDLPAAPAPAPTPTEVAGRAIDVSIAGGKITPAPGRVQVKQGEKVTITVASDVADTLHVHGYDLEAEFGPGKPGSVSFTADQSGLFEVETHDTEKLLFQLVVR